MFINHKGELKHVAADGSITDVDEFPVKTFDQNDSLVRPANANAYAINKSINCNVTVTGVAYALKVVTLTAANAFTVGDRITVAGADVGATVTNVDGDWVCKTGTNATTVVFDVTTQPTGVTPQVGLNITGAIAKCLSLDLASAAGNSILLSRLSVTLPGVAMTGAIRCYVYTAQPTVLVDQAAFTLLQADRANRRDYYDLTPITEGAGSDCTFACVRPDDIIKCAPGDTRLYFRLVAEAAGTPANAGWVTIRAIGTKMMA